MQNYTQEVERGIFEIYLALTKHNANTMRGMYYIKTAIHQIRIIYITVSYLIS